MALPVPPPVSPMLAKASPALPAGDGWSFEPKFDGFRCIVFRDGDDVELGSRNERPLTRYFPEILRTAARRAARPRRRRRRARRGHADYGLDFDLLSLRIHPAASRIDKLAEEIPVSFVGFDLLAEGDDDLRERAVRRAAGPARGAWLGARRRRCTSARRPPTATVAAKLVRPLRGRRARRRDREAARRPVQEGERAHGQGEAPSAPPTASSPGTAPTSRAGSARCSSASTTTPARCTTSAWRAASRRRCARSSKPTSRRTGDRALEGHPWADWAEGPAEATPDRRMPGGQSRWTGGKDLSWEPVRPELVVEVAYEHVQRVGGSPTVEAAGSVTRPASSVGAPTAIPRRAPTTSSTPPSPPSSRISVPPSTSVLGCFGLAGLDAAGLAALLGEVGRPGLVAEAFGLVARGELEQRVERERARRRSRPTGRRRRRSAPGRWRW